MSAGNFQGTYSAEKVIVTVGGVILSGFADGDFVTAKFNQDRYTTKVGADGEVGRSKTADRTGTIEINLSHTSKANAELSALFNLSMLSGVEPTIPIGVADLSGKALAGASRGWLKTAPDWTRGKEISETKWTFEVADLKISY